MAVLTVLLLVPNRDAWSVSAYLVERKEESSSHEVEAWAELSVFFWACRDAAGASCRVDASDYRAAFLQYLRSLRPVALSIHTLQATHLFSSRPVGLGATIPNASG
jgi:hypothetical protein